MSRVIRVALVGYGIAGSTFHAPFIRTTPGMELTSVVVSNPERQAQARAAHPDTAVLERPELLWEQAGRHDLAVIATPNRSHLPLAMHALEVGLAVVVEKPMAASVEDGARLIETARRRGLMLSVHHNRRWDGDFLTVRRLLADGALGPVLRFESRFERWRPEPRAGAWRELADPLDAGGVLFDLGSHLIDQALVLFGRPARVYAEVRRRRPAAVVDDDVFVALTHEGGAVSHLWASSIAGQLGHRFRVLGLRAAYTKRGLDGQEAALRAGERPAGDGWGREPRERWGLIGAGDDLEPVETAPGAYPEFYRRVAAAIRDGAAPPVLPEEALLVLRIIEAARSSERRGAAVEL